MTAQLTSLQRLHIIARFDVRLKLEETQQSDTMAVEAVIWTAGQRATPLAGPLPLDDRGRLRCNSELQLEGLPQIFALGDGAAVPHEPSLPATAQVAKQQVDEGP